MFPLRDRNPTRHRAYVTLALILVNVAVFVLIQPQSGVETLTLPTGEQATIDAPSRFAFEFAAIPCELTENRPLDASELQQLDFGDARCNDGPGAPLFPAKNVWLGGLTSMFLHADWFHLGGNMLFLWIFGNNIEDHLGPVRYLVFYLLAGAVALAAHVGLQVDSAIPVVGASGAVAGVMGAYLAWFPKAPIQVILIIVLRDIRARWLLSIWFVTQFFTGQDSSVAWAAHVGGFIFGFALGALVRFVRPVRNGALRQPWRSLRSKNWDPTGGAGAPRPTRSALRR